MNVNKYLKVLIFHILDSFLFRRNIMKKETRTKQNIVGGIHEYYSGYF